jgi:hypothetical protein
MIYLVETKKGANPYARIHPPELWSKFNIAGISRTYIYKIVGRLSEKPFFYSVFEQILIFFNIRLFRGKNLYFYPIIFLVSRDPYAILFNPL